jgi:hypothetical protein
MSTDARVLIRTLAERLGLAVWTTDKRMRITLYVDGDGRGPEETSGSGGKSRPVNGSGRVVFDAHRRALRGESVAFGYVRGGKSYEAVVEPLANERGHLVGCLGIALDVTAYRRDGLARRNGRGNGSGRPSIPREGVGRISPDPGA